MPPRLRTLVWREMPPCVRRLGIAWSRRLFHVELYLGRMYLSWTKSPTWNFVAIAGTLGIVLTILLFLVPWDAESAADAGAGRVAQSPRPAWELDARLTAFDSPKNQAYPVEFLLDGDRGIMFADTNPGLDRRRRRSRVDEPLLSEFAGEPVPRARRKSEPEPVLTRDEDWFDSGTKSPPKLGLDVEVVLAKRRARRNLVIADAVWSGCSLPPEVQLPSRRFRPEMNDRWTASNPRRIVREQSVLSSDFDEEHMLIASHADPPAGSAWEPVPFPTTAPPTVCVELELTWNRRTSRRRSEPRLSVRNLSEETIDRIDVLPGPFPEFDLSAPSEMLTQSIGNLASQSEEAVALPLAVSQRRSSRHPVSVLITTFVGGTTRITAERAEPVAKSARSEFPEPAPRRRPVGVREPDRPHLSLTVGKAGRLPREKMVSVPIAVVNDGNVPLSEVVILAKIPATLEHEHGRHVHYRLGALQPGEQRHSTLLLTPREAGSTTVPLEAVDGDRLAFASGEAGIDVADEELAEAQVRRSRRRDDRTPRR